MADLKKQLGSEASHAGCSCNGKSGQKSSPSERDGHNLKRENKSEGRDQMKDEQNESSSNKNLK